MGNKYLITFDLHTSEEYEYILKKIYNKSLTNMYRTIYKHFFEHDFSWIEGSVYYSNKEITQKELEDVLYSLYQNNLWLSIFTRDIKRTVIKEEIYEYNDIVKEFQGMLSLGEKEILKQLQHINELYEENENDEEPPTPHRGMHR